MIKVNSGKTLTQVDYKREQEAFVSNWNGTNVGELATIFLMLPISIWLYLEVLALMERFFNFKAKQSFGFLCIQYFLEVALLAFPILLSYTYSEYTILVEIIGLSLSLTLRLISSQRKNTQPNKSTKNMEKENIVISCFRAQMMLSTCIAILAVDFPVFPRRFAKTEAFGVSIMDIGVGAFVFSLGLTSKSARGIKDPPVADIYELFRPMIPIFCLGIARLVTIKSLDYQEHVSEYGVHWNFYFTLASVYFGSIVLNLIRLNHWFMALIILGAYQFSLMYLQLEEYMLNAPRIDFISQNREGLLSSIGYQSLYLLSMQIGKIFFIEWRKGHENKKNLFLFLIILAIFLWISFWFCDTILNIPPSRRLLNLSYVLWILAQASLLLLSLSISFFISSIPQLPLLFQGISRNQLFVFLLSNLATGLVNQSMQTIYASSIEAMTILSIYLISICILSWCLQYWNLSIKL